MKKELQSLVFSLAIFPLFLASHAVALEKSAARFADVDRDDDAWRSGTETCSIAYYNTCTGWIWIWSGWSPEDRIGVHFESCCADSLTGHVLTGWMFVATGSPMGYGFTGAVEVWNSDGNGCPTGNPLASKTLLPTATDPAGEWNLIDFGPSGVPVQSSFAFTYTLGAGSPNPLGLASDHPAAGPTGPAACGSCYPTTRVARSFYLGTPQAPLCPGSALADDVCDAELLWDVQLECRLSTISVDRSSWSDIKALYR
jgi:hypothetical protein